MKIVAASIIALGFVAVVCGQNVIQNCSMPGTLAMTFDDGPHPFLTGELLDLFKSYNFSTTFFILGPGNWESDVRRYRETVKRAFDEGHQIGSHSWSHSNMSDNMSDDEIRSELSRIADLTYDIIGKNLTVFRPPYGSYNDQLLRIATEEFGYSVVNWNIDTNDWSHPSDPLAGLDEYIKEIESQQHSSYIGLHHDWTNTAVELANMTIQYVHQQNLTIVTVAECIGVPMYR